MKADMLIEIPANIFKLLSNDSCDRRCSVASDGSLLLKLYVDLVAIH